MFGGSHGPGWRYSQYPPRGARTRRAEPARACCRGPRSDRPSPLIDPRNPLPNGP
ncbi:hypothetical protein ATKI12_2104 [Kitasatospora sp. Ki12]